MMDQYHELELKEILARTNSLSSTRVQLFSFFGTLDLTFIGFSIELENPLFLILGATSLIFLLILDGFVRDQMYALYARALMLEQLYCPNTFTGAIFSMTKAALVKSEIHRLKDLLENNSDQEKLTKLLKACRSSRFGFLLPFSVMIVQSLIGVIMYLT